MNSKHLNSHYYATAFQLWYCCATFNNSEVMERWGSERAAAIFVSLCSGWFLLGGSVVTTETGEGWHSTSGAGVGLVGWLGGSRTSVQRGKIRVCLSLAWCLFPSFPQWFYETWLLNRWCSQMLVYLLKSLFITYCSKNMQCQKMIITGDLEELGEVV